MASSSEIINIIFKVQGNIDKAVDSATKKVQSMADSVSNLSQKFAPISGLAAVALGGSVKLAADFNEAMSGATRAMDLSGASLEKFKSQMLGLEKELKYQFTSTELTNIATGASKLGVATADIDDFTRSLAKIAVATDQADKIEELATNAAKIQTVFKLNVKQLDDYLNAVNRLDDATSATSNQILNFTQRVAGSASTSKISANAIAAYGSTLISAGQAPESAATFMNKFISVLGAATNLSPKAQKKLAVLGYTATDLSKRFDKDANGTMLEFLNRVKSLSSIQQRDVLGKVFGQEHVNSALLIVQQSKELAANLKASGESAKNAAKAQNEFNKAAESFKGVSTTFKNQLAAIGMQIGSIILPVLTSFMTKISPLVQKILEMTQTQPKITKWIVGFLLIGALIAPILGVVAAIGSFIAFITPVIGGIAGIVTGIAALIVAFWDFIAVGATVGALAGTIKNQWSSITGFFSTVFKGISDWGKWAWADLMNGSKMAAFVFNKMFNDLGDWAFKGVQNMIMSFARFYNWLSGLGSNFFNMAVNWGRGLIQGFINGIQSMYSNVTGVMTNFTNWLRQFLPSSDAKRGGLSDLTASGQSFADTFMGGIENSGLDSRLNNLLTSPATPSALLSTPGSTNTNSSQNITIAPVYNVSGGNADDILKQLKAKEKQLLDLINSATAKNYRSSY